MRTLCGVSLIQQSVPGCHAGCMARRDERCTRVLDGDLRECRDECDVPGCSIWSTCKSVRAIRARYIYVLLIRSAGTTAP